MLCPLYLEKVFEVFLLVSQTCCPVKSTTRKEMSRSCGKSVIKFDTMFFDITFPCFPRCIKILLNTVTFSLYYLK